MDELKRAKVAVVPGAFFASDPEGPKSPFVRLSFAYATDDDIKEGIRRLGALLRAGTPAESSAWNLWGLL